MTLISDGTIRRLIDTGTIQLRREDGDPMNPNQFQTCSVDVTLKHLVQECWEFDPKEREYKLHSSENVQYMAFRPYCFVIGATQEQLILPPSIAADIKGKSSLARLGLGVEFAGFIDPGFGGTITLELKNLHPFRTIHLRTDMKIAQIRFQWLDVGAVRPYGHPDLGSHYQGQSDATQSYLA